MSRSFFLEYIRDRHVALDGIVLVDYIDHSMLFFYEYLFFFFQMYNQASHNLDIMFDHCFFFYYLLEYFRINPQNEAAKKGLERLEKQMKVCCTFTIAN